MAYTTDEVVEPFWAQYSNDASGRDPLAIQNSSGVIYTKMISGITNVTIRIRYNGFYCWLIESILKEKAIIKNNSKEEQIRYIRRGELLIAFIMANNFPDVTGISGIAYAGKNLKSSISLKNGADWDTKDDNKLYWQAKLGAFGQYFIGVLRDLDLIYHPQDEIQIYTLTPKGKELAGAFSKNIPAEEIKLFMRCILTGKVKETELSELTSFSIVDIPKNSAEYAFYQKMLLSSDTKREASSFHRKNSIQLLLSLLQKERKGVENVSLSFLKANYNSNRKLKELTDNTSTAWYLYEMNELVHLAFEHIHVCFLYSMETYPKLLEEVIDELVNQAGAELKKSKVPFKTELLSDYIKKIKTEKEDVYGIYQLMNENYKEGEYGACLVNAIQIFITVYLNAQRQLSFLKEYASKAENRFNRQGNVNDLLEEVLTSKTHLTLKEYFKKVLFTAINQHTFSSYTKSRIGQGMVHNYLIEDNCVWRIRETDPNRTSPRLQNVTQYIADLGWVSREGKLWKITDKGSKIQIDL